MFVRDVYSALMCSLGMLESVGIKVSRFVQLRSTGAGIMAARDKREIPIACTCEVDDLEARWVLVSRQLGAGVQFLLRVFVACACAVCGLGLKYVDNSVGNQVPMCIGVRFVQLDGCSRPGDSG